MDCGHAHRSIGSSCPDLENKGGVIDYGGINDGQCEFSFFTRCPEQGELEEVTFGQFDTWTYLYCPDHATQAKEDKKKEWNSLG
jgi:hypothetical protein